MASPCQDLIAILQLLASAIGEYGCPAGIVSDNGAVFTAHAYQAVLAALEIEACYIEKGKPWQNLTEAAFKIETRLADPIFAEAQTLDELQAAHVRFLATYNTTAHWAHKDRADELRTPEAVLGWVCGPMVEPDTLRQVLRQLQVERVVDRRGYVSIQRFAIYAERSLARQRVSIWLYEGRLHIEYQQTLLARYSYRYDRKHKRLRDVRKPQLYATAFASPQLERCKLDDQQWRKVLSRPVRLPRVQPVAAMEHLEQLAFQLVG